MTTPLLNISGKIDPTLAELCEMVSACAKNLNIPYLVVGASARDMVLHYGYGAAIQRATADIDFALQVPSWDSFAALKQELIKTGFSETPMSHRLISLTKWPIDIVPFGGVADEHANIQWPPSGDLIMNVLGFQEALDNAKMVRLRNEPIVDIPVATSEGMTILKLIAWMDRAADKRTKDAKDIAYLFATYEKIPAISDLLYQEQTLMELYDWDLTLASAHQLGVNTRQISLAQTQQSIIFLLNDQHPKLRCENLIHEMCDNSTYQYARNEVLLSAFKAGFLK